MKPIKFISVNKNPTAAQKQLLKKEREMDAELDRLGMKIFPVFTYALFDLYGWKKRHIMEVLYSVNRVYDDCTAETTKSMIQYCYEETGINVSNSSEKNWDELYFLSEDLWQQKLATMKDFKTQEQQDRFMYLVRVQQIKWIEPTIYASLFIALHRREKFGYDKLVALYAHMKQIITSYKPKEIIAMIKSEIDIDIEVYDGLFRFGNKEEE